MKLKRPLAVIDVQSSGHDAASARIVKLSVLKVEPGGSEHLKSVVVNPEIPILPMTPDYETDVDHVHGISDLDVIGMPVFRSYARALADHLEDCDFAGFGIERFGLPLLQAEFERNSIEFDVSGRSVVDVQVVLDMLMLDGPISFKRAYSRYVNFSPHHKSSSYSVQNVFVLLQAVVGKVQDLPTDLELIKNWQQSQKAKMEMMLKEEVMLRQSENEGHLARDRRKIDEILEEPSLMEILIDIHEATGSGEDEID